MAWGCRSVQHAWPFAMVTAAALASAWQVKLARFEHRPPVDIVAQVGARSMSRAELESSVAQVTADLQPHPSPQVRSEVLRKLIDEELLYQDGVALGLPETDPVVRLGIVRAMIAMADAPVPASTGDSTVGAQTNRGIDQYIDWLRHRSTIEFEGAP